LVDAVELGLDVVLGAGADMAIDAADPGVGGGEVGGHLRVHGPVAGLAAEVGGFGVVIGLGDADGGDQQEGESAGDEELEDAAVAGR
jgi:hypothetical protein